MKPKEGDLIKVHREGKVLDGIVESLSQRGVIFVPLFSDLALFDIAEAKKEAKKGEVVLLPRFRAKLSDIVGNEPEEKEDVLDGLLD